MACPCWSLSKEGQACKSPRPLSNKWWVASVLTTHRVILLDQRDNGRITRVQVSSIAGMDAAVYLLCSRAGWIVADREFLRKQVFGGVRWQMLGRN